MGAEGKKMREQFSAFYKSTVVYPRSNKQNKYHIDILHYFLNILTNKCVKEKCAICFQKMKSAKRVDISGSLLWLIGEQLLPPLYWTTRVLFPKYVGNGRRKTRKGRSRKQGEKWEPDMSHQTLSSIHYWLYHDRRTDQYNCGRGCLVNNANSGPMNQHHSSPPHFSTTELPLENWKLRWYYTIPSREMKTCGKSRLQLRSF